MSSYVESVLGSGEEILYEGNVSLWSLSPLIVLGFILLPFIIGPIFWIIALIRYKTTELAITNKKIIAKFGFISRNTIELLLPKIESVQVNQSILGRIFGYGSIVASGAGNPQAPVAGITQPIEFRKKFMEIQESVQNGDAQT
tara:strand:- start:94 stop:522 length:429 start_codon:yes stop_codon:yes gene_type:complete